MEERMIEKHYRVKELAQLWGVSRQTIQRIFVDEHGVVAIGKPRTRHRRPHLTLLIPESVVARVKNRCDVAVLQ
jgi:AraC-like DNA-binding protein